MDSLRFTGGDLSAAFKVDIAHTCSTKHCLFISFDFILSSVLFMVAAMMHMSEIHILAGISSPDILAPVGFRPSLTMVES